MKRWKVALALGLTALLATCPAGAREIMKLSGIPQGDSAEARCWAGSKA